MRFVLSALSGVALVLALCGCGGGAPKVADEPIKRKRDPRATRDDPNAEAVKPPAPPEEDARAAEVDTSGLSAVEREAIAAMKKNAGASERPVARVTPATQENPATQAAPVAPATPKVPVKARGADGAVAGLGPWVVPAGPIPAVPVRGKKPEALMRLAPARKESKWKITQQIKSGEAVEVPPPGVFDLVKYKSPAGELAAYVSPDPKDGTKRAAIVWITGGDCNTIGNVWDDIDLTNEQSATAYRNAGIVMMFPSLRGGNQNPGIKEAFLGEVDDVVAAGEYLSKLPYVDPKRVYLGGHSSGGTMALLAAESTPLFRAAFCFGPTSSIAGYLPGDEQLAMPFDHTNKVALGIRSPVMWLDSIERPTFVIEGTEGNYDALKHLEKVNKNPFVTILAVQDADHFQILHPLNSLIAKKILTDTTAESNITLTASDVKKAMGK